LYNGHKYVLSDVEEEVLNYAVSIAAAERLLTQSLGTAVSLHLADVVYDYAGAASTVLRCHVDGPASGLPATLIVKRANTETNTLAYEVAGLTFAQKHVPDLVPRCFAADAASSIVVMEDLGTDSAHLLGNILFSEDKQLAEEALLAFNQALGRLHRATIAQQDSYQHLCRYYQVQKPSRHRIHSLTTDVANLVPLLASLAIPVSTHLERDVQTIIAELRDPGPFYTFSHGDATPANSFYTAAGIRLFDFESSGFRHALLDGSFARLRYIHSVWARHIPPALQQRMEQAYRSALSEGCPAASDDTIFYRSLTCCAAAWLAGLCTLLPTVKEQDQRWGRSTNRQRIAAGLDHFLMRPEHYTLLPALAGAAEMLKGQVQQWWPEADCTMRPYPALSMPD
jgi:thiamine kinase-like enzyme